MNIHELVRQENDAALGYMYFRMVEILTGVESVPMSYAEIAEICAMRSSTTARRKVQKLIDAELIVCITAEEKHRRHRYALPTPPVTPKIGDQPNVIDMRAPRVWGAVAAFRANIPQNLEKLGQNLVTDIDDRDINLSPHIEINLSGYRDALGVANTATIKALNESGLSAGELREIIARCVGYGAKSWSYVLKAISTELDKRAGAAVQVIAREQALDAMNSVYMSDDTPPVADVVPVAAAQVADTADTELCSIVRRAIELLFGARDAHVRVAGIDELGRVMIAAVSQRIAAYLSTDRLAARLNNELCAAGLGGFVLVEGAA